jgi:hypothetical protein
MKFRISREKPIRWPNKCVWCRNNPIMRYPLVRKVEVEYPVCRKHFFWSMGIKIGYLVSYVGIVLSLILINPLFIYLFLFSTFLMSIGFIILLLSTGMFFLSIVLDPVRIRKVRKDFYTMIIRNEEYAREFAMLNSLNPKPGVFGDAGGG